MFSRRDFLTASVALATIFGPGIDLCPRPLVARHLNGEGIAALDAGEDKVGRATVAALAPQKTSTPKEET